jgi:hypothetical protein
LEIAQLSHSKCPPYDRKKALFVQGNIQFGGKLVRVKRAASKKAVTNLDRGHFSAAFIYLKNEILGIGLLVDIHFDEVHIAIPQEFPRAVAIHAPTCAIHCDFFHSQFDDSADGGDSRRA